MLFHYLIFVICIATTQCYVQAAAAAGAGAGKKVETQKIDAQEQELPLPLPLAQVIPEPQPGAVAVEPKIDDPIMAKIVSIVRSEPQDSLYKILTEEHIDYIVAHRDEFIKAVGTLSKKRAGILDQRIRDRISLLNALRDAVMNDASEKRLNRLIDEGASPFFEKGLASTDLYAHEKLNFDLMSPFLVAFWHKKATALKLFNKLNPQSVAEQLSFHINLIMDGYNPVLKSKLLNTVRWFFKEIIHPNKIDLPFSKMPYLIVYAKRDYPDIVNILLHAGADPNIKYEEPVFVGDQEGIRITSFIQELPNYSPAIQKVWADYQAYLAQQRQEMQRELNKNNRLPVHDIQKLIGEYL